MEFKRCSPVLGEVGRDGTRGREFLSIQVATDLQAGLPRTRYPAAVRWTALYVLLAAAIACDRPAIDSVSGRPGGTRDPGTLIVGRPADAISLDPARVTDNESVEVCEQIYEGLLRYRSGSNEIEPGLAESYEVSDDGRVWTFHLRRAVSFHDGTPLTADAVVFSFQRQLDPDHTFHRDDATGLPFAWASTYRNIQSVEATGPHTVRITIARKYAPFLANLAMFPVAIVSPAAIATHGEEYYRHPVGTGPFRFSEWEGGRIVLERNDGYWGEHAAMERLVFRSIPDGRQRLVGLESGAIDVAYSILPEEQQFVALHPALALYRAEANNVAYLAMNTAKPPWDDRRVRQAFNHAVAKEPIVKLAYQGMATAAHGPLPPSQWGYHAGGTRYPHDPDRARELLAQAAADGRFDPSRVYSLYVPTTPRPYLPAPEMVARIVRSNLADIGVEVEIVEHGIRDHLAAVRRGEHDLCLLGWVGDNGDPDNFLYVLLDRDNTELGAARNLAFFRDDEVHELLIAAQRAHGREQREAIYMRAQERISAEAPWVPIAHSQVVVAARAEIGGMAIGPSTHVDFVAVTRR